MARSAFCGTYRRRSVSSSTASTTSATRSSVSSPPATRVADLRFMTEVTRLILAGDFDGACQVADYMREEDVPGHERAQLLVATAGATQHI